jgi:hypothetical protein
MAAAAGCLALFLGWYALGHWEWASAPPNASSPAADPLASLNEPYAYPTLAEPVFDSESKEARMVRRLLDNPPRIPLNGPILCHALLLYRLDKTTITGLPTGEDIVRVLTRDQAATKLLGTNLLVPTRYGVRYLLAPDRLSPDGESHRDVMLSTFAEIGLPLSTTVDTGGESFTLRDLLRDSVETFNPHEKEIAWTANAYSLYMRRMKGWTTRDGERFTFDDLADSLLARNLSQESCGGTHIMMAITTLIRVDSETPVLSTSRRNALIQSLQIHVQSAIASQDKDGSWTLWWGKNNRVRPAYANAPSFKLLITGHLLQWLEYLPKDLQPPATVYHAAAEWLCDELPKLDPNHFDSQSFCPWTHGVCAVRNLVQHDKIAKEFKSAENRHDS